MQQELVFGRLELRSLANKRKSRAVAEAILDAIRAGRLGPEERLPSERTLADQLGVSRGAVREALSALQLSGAIQIRTGEGSFVAPGAAAPASADRTLSILDQNKSPLELWEARRELEVTLSRMALQVASDGDLDTVGRHLDAMREAASVRDLGAYIVANDAFHESLVRPVENSILRDFGVELIQATNQLMTRDSVWTYLDRNLPASVEKHRAIYDAMVGRDEADLSAAVVHHYDELVKHYLEE